jgi:hypothetical protein
MSRLLDTKPIHIIAGEARKFLIDTKAKCIREGKARNSLKLGSTSPSLNLEHKPFLIDASRLEA